MQIPNAESQRPESVRAEPELRPPPSGERMVVALLDVMLDLAELIRAENALLARGQPTSLAGMTQRKLALSGEFSGLQKIVLHRHKRVIAENAVLRRRLKEVGRELDALARENLERLEATMAASRRRIESVMAAVRGHHGGSRGYGSAGVAAAPSFLAGRADRRA
jgi:hypothetical protein